MCVSGLGGLVGQCTERRDTHFEFGVDCVQATDQVLEEQFECLWQAKQVLALLVGRQEGRDPGTTIVDQATLVRGHVLGLCMARATRVVWV